MMSEDILFEIQFWLNNIRSLNCREVCNDRSPKVFNLIEDDASATGYGSILNNDLTLVAARKLSNEERDMHSTWRQLANIHFSLTSFLPNIKFSRVNFLVDSQSVAKIINTGNMKLDLQWFTMSIFKVCLFLGMSLKDEWVPQTQNELTDEMSCQADTYDTDDWGFTEEFFSFPNNHFGAFTLDAFANFYNTKCSKVYSLYMALNCSRINTFSFDWKEENVLMVPAVTCIDRALIHLKICKSRGVLVAPKWPSAHYWPMLLNEFSGFISDFLVVKANKVLSHGLNKNSLLGAPLFNAEMIVM